VTSFDPPSNPLVAGDRVLLLDDRGRTYLLRLQTGQVFHFHGGAVQHDLVIGSDEGTVVHSGTGTPLTCYRPRLADFVLKMPRGAQVVYPKDLGAIVMEADVFPGARVLEAGTGSGALCIALARAAGSSGRVVSYEMRGDFHAKARENIEAFFGKVPPELELREADVRTVPESGDIFDRAVLDLPEPWRALDALESVLVPGGIVCSFLPTTGQIQTLVLDLQRRGFQQVHTFEVMQRSWHVAERSVRPDHRMVGHTGFLVSARLVRPEPSTEEPSASNE
jgi:tRNA (adenine57-N1/adenine58-N1)-methyltransferase